MRLKIRRAKPQDARRIREVHVASVRGLCSGDYSPAQIRAWTWKRELQYYRDAMARGTMWVAVMGRSIIAFAQHEPGMLNALYVHPRCSKLGVGRRLVRCVERHAHGRGEARLRLDSSLTAEPFYQRHGFRRVKRIIFRFRKGGSIRAVSMIKRLP